MTITIEDLEKRKGSLSAELADLEDEIGMELIKESVKQVKKIENARRKIEMESNIKLIDEILLDLKEKEVEGKG